MKGIVYRCYDAKRQLIYVGSTMATAEERLSQHRYQHRVHGRSTWIADVDHVEVDQYPSWQEALAAEAALIAVLEPVGNTRGNPARQAKARDNLWTSTGVEHYRRLRVVA